MKKIITVLLLITLIVSNLLFGVSADNSSFSQLDAEKLITDAIDKYSLIQYGHIGKYVESDNIPGIGYPYIMYDSENNSLIYEYSSKGEKYDNNYRTDFFLVNDPRFDSMEKCYAFLESAFTDELAKSLIDYNDKYGVEIFRPSDGGKIKKGSSVDEYKDTPSGRIVTSTVVRDPVHMRTRIESIGKIQVNGDTATLQVVCGYIQFKQYVENPEKYYYYERNDAEIISYYNMDIQFQNTSNGWRISGGSFIDHISYKTDPNPENAIKNPSTGSPTSIYLALAGAAILCALPVVKRKRREY